MGPFFGANVFTMIRFKSLGRIRYILHMKIVSKFLRFLSRLANHIQKFGFDDVLKVQPLLFHTGMLDEIHQHLLGIT